MKNLKMKSSAAVLMLAASSIVGQNAMAQSMNYGSLQDLFGEPVTTSATGKPQRASEAPAAMTIVTADEITKSGARTLTDVLNRVSGIDLSQWSNTSADVGIRGYNQGRNPKILVLVNGRQVYQDFYGLTLWSSIPVQLSEIRQIEVVKGPQSALFGFNAVSGVINIVTYSPLYDDAGSADVTVGTQGFKEFNFVKTVKLSDWGGVRVSAGGWGMNAFDTNTNPMLTRFYDRDSLRRTASIDSLFQLTPDVQAGLEATLGRQSEYGFTPTAQQERGTYEARSLKGSIKANSAFGLIEGTIYQNKMKVAAVFPGNTISTTTDTTVAQLQDLVKLTDDVTTRVGVEYRDNSLNSWPLRGSKTGYRNYALSNMVDWQLSPALTLTAAGRWDHTALQHTGAEPYPFTDADYDRNLESFSYNAGLVWRVSDQDSLLLTAGRGIGAPNLIELSNTNVTKPRAGSVLITGNPDIDPSVTTNYEVGWRRSIDGIGGFGRVSLSHQKTTDLKFINLARPKLINGYPTLLLGDNLGSSAAWVLETELSGKADALRWNLSWVWMDTNDSLDIANILIGQNYEQSNARNTIKANVGWDRGPWNTDLFLTWKSDTKVYFNDGTGMKLLDVSPGLTAEASVGYQVTESLRISLSGANLLKDKTQLTASPKVERRAWATASFKL